MPCYCIVLNCQTPSRAKGRSYCRIPAIITNQGEETQRLSEERRRLWLAAINRGELTENTLQHARVCGAHFVSGKAAPLWNRTSVDWVPTLNLRLQTISVDEERAQERAWRQFTKRRRREAGHQMIGAHSIEEKHSSGAQAGGDTTAPSTSKRARVSDSLQHGGEDLHGAGDHVSEEDSTPMVGTLGFSKETTLALLNRMFTEELLSELNRRSIVVKPAGGDRPRGRSDLEHVLREVMTREYEEAEGNSGTSMDTSNTSSTFEHSRSDASSSFEHSSRLDEETSGSEVFSGPNNEQAPTDNIQEPTMMIQQTSTSRQAADMNISEAPSTSSAYPVEVLVKKEPVEDVEYCVATSSSSSNIVASTTEPSTSQTGHPGIGDGSQGRLARNLSQAERIKTESEVEEGTEDIEQEDLSSEHCPSSPRQLSQELDKVEVSTEDEGDAKPSTSTEEPVKKKRKTRQLREWDKDKIEEILKDIAENKLTISTASRKYGVPRSTLYDKVQGKSALDANLGRPLVILQDEEDSINYYMKYRAEHGFPTTKKTILALALEVHLRHCAENGTAPKIDPQKGLSKSWWKRFKERNSKILRQLGSLNNLSTKSVDKTKYFDQLTATMTKEGLTGRPHRIYHADEVGFDLDPKMEPLTFAKLNVPGAAIRTGGHDHKLSCLECVAADGAAIPPLITFSKSFPTNDYRSEGPNNALYAVTPSGLVEGDAFLRWLQECFLPFCSPVRPVLVLMDPSSTHVTPEVIDFALKNDIVFMALPFRTTVFRHPLDVPFDRMKTKFNRAVKARLAPDFKSTFCKIYNEARKCVLSKAVIKKAFKKSGVTPVRENRANQYTSTDSKGGDNHDDEAEDRYPALLPEEREMMARAEELEDEEYHRDKGRTHAVPEIDSDEEETEQLLEDEDPSWMCDFFTESTED
ncbi:uncharacterized protein LOC118415445 isoform X3 [Branchiostoma floridae]|uniref:Uncharacterized protein LOC118415445 isoform X3 n=1 Tax=Branchiostoma floridae TaxID=7739 RepID=A0A9J7MR37_BRAFL|nr:uncharacterized protein LOC118415445 isoform X3 [Branchiostoma floridae]